MLGPPKHPKKKRVNKKDGESILKFIERITKNAEKGIVVKIAPKLLAEVVGATKKKGEEGAACARAYAKFYMADKIAREVREEIVAQGSAVAVEESVPEEPSKLKSLKQRLIESVDKSLYPDVIKDRYLKFLRGLEENDDEQVEKVKQYLTTNPGQITTRLLKILDSELSLSSPGKPATIESDFFASTPNPVAYEAPKVVASPKEQQPSLTIEFAEANEYFKKNKDAVKLSKKNTRSHKNSFIKVGSEVYQIANGEYLGIGAFGKVKIVQNAKGEKFALKIEAMESDAEVPILKDLDLFIGRAILKGRWKSLFGRLKQDKDQNQSTKNIHQKVYTITKLRTGEELYKKLETTPLTQKQKLLIALKSCQAIQELHSKGILHRDIKPENFMVDIQGDKIKIDAIDFGLAKKLPKGTKQITAARDGSAGYKSPEIEKEGIFSFASDIYALGTMFKFNLGLDQFREMRFQNPEHRPSLKETMNKIVAELQAKHELTAEDQIVLKEAREAIHVAEVASTPPTEMPKLKVNKKEVGVIMPAPPVVPTAVYPIEHMPIKQPVARKPEVVRVKRDGRKMAQFIQFIAKLAESGKIVKMSKKLRSKIESPRYSESPAYKRYKDAENRTKAQQETSKAVARVGAMVRQKQESTRGEAQAVESTLAQPAKQYPEEVSLSSAKKNPELELKKCVKMLQEVIEKYPNLKAIMTVEFIDEAIKIEFPNDELAKSKMVMGNALGETGIMVDENDDIFYIRTTDIEGRLEGLPKYDFGNELSRNLENWWIRIEKASAEVVSQTQDRDPLAEALRQKLQGRGIPQKIGDLERNLQINRAKIEREARESEAQRAQPAIVEEQQVPSPIPTTPQLLELPASAPVPEVPSLSEQNIITFLSSQSVPEGSIEPSISSSAASSSSQIPVNSDLPTPLSVPVSASVEGLDSLSQPSTKEESKRIESILRQYKDKSDLSSAADMLVKDDRIADQTIEILGNIIDANNDISDFASQLVVHLATQFPALLEDEEQHQDVHLTEEEEDEVEGEAPSQPLVVVTAAQPVLDAVVKGVTSNPKDALARIKQEFHESGIFADDEIIKIDEGNPPKLRIDWLPIGRHKYANEGINLQELIKHVHKNDKVYFSALEATFAELALLTVDQLKQMGINLTKTQMENFQAKLLSFKSDTTSLDTNFMGRDGVAELLSYPSRGFTFELDDEFAYIFSNKIFIKAMGNLLKKISAEKELEYMQAQGEDDENSLYLKIPDKKAKLTISEPEEAAASGQAKLLRQDVQDSLNEAIGHATKEFNKVESAKREFIAAEAKAAVAEKEAELAIEKVRPNDLTDPVELFNWIKVQIAKGQIPELTSQQKENLAKYAQGKSLTIIVGVTGFEEEAEEEAEIQDETEEAEEAEEAVRIGGILAGAGKAAAKKQKDIERAQKAKEEASKLSKENALRVRANVNLAIELGIPVIASDRAKEAYAKNRGFKPKAVLSKVAGGAFEVDVLKTKLKWQEVEMHPLREITLLTKPRYSFGLLGSYGPPVVDVERTLNLAITLRRQGFNVAIPAVTLDEWSKIGRAAGLMREYETSYITGYHDIRQIATQDARTLLEEDPEKELDSDEFLYAQVVQCMAEGVVPKFANDAQKEAVRKYIEREKLNEPIIITVKATSGWGESEIDKFKAFTDNIRLASELGILVKPDETAAAVYEANRSKKGALPVVGVKPITKPRWGFEVLGRVIDEPKTKQFMETLQYSRADKPGERQQINVALPKPPPTLFQRVREAVGLKREPTARELQKPSKSFSDKEKDLLHVKRTVPTVATITYTPEIAARHPLFKQIDANQKVKRQDLLNEAGYKRVMMVVNVPKIDERDKGVIYLVKGKRNMKDSVIAHYHNGEEWSERDKTEEDLSKDGIKPADTTSLQDIDKIRKYFNCTRKKSGLQEYNDATIRSEHADQPVTQLDRDVGRGYSYWFPEAVNHEIFIPIIRGGKVIENKRFQLSAQGQLQWAIEEDRSKYSKDVAAFIAKRKEKAIHGEDVQDHIFREKVFGDAQGNFMNFLSVLPQFQITAEDGDHTIGEDNNVSFYKAGIASYPDGTTRFLMNMELYLVKDTDQNFYCRDKDGVVHQVEPEYYIALGKALENIKAKLDLNRSSVLDTDGMDSITITSEDGVPITITPMMTMSGYVEYTPSAKGIFGGLKYQPDKYHLSIQSHTDKIHCTDRLAQVVTAERLVEASSQPAPEPHSASVSPVVTPVVSPVTPAVTSVVPLPPPPILERRHPPSKPGAVPVQQPAVEASRIRESEEIPLQPLMEKEVVTKKPGESIHELMLRMLDFSKQNKYVKLKKPRKELRTYLETELTDHLKKVPEDLPLYKQFYDRNELNRKIYEDQKERRKVPKASQPQIVSSASLKPTKQARPVDKEFILQSAKRAFQEAGVRTEVVAQWQVDDQYFASAQGYVKTLTDKQKLPAEIWLNFADKEHREATKNALKSMAVESINIENASQERRKAAGDALYLIVPLQNLQKVKLDPAIGNFADNFNDKYIPPPPPPPPSTTHDEPKPLRRVPQKELRKEKPVALTLNPTPINSASVPMQSMPAKAQVQEIPKPSRVTFSPKNPANQQGERVVVTTKCNLKAIKDLIKEKNNISPETYKIIGPEEGTKLTVQTHAEPVYLSEKPDGAGVEFAVKLQGRQNKNRSIEIACELAVATAPKGTIFDIPVAISAFVRPALKVAIKKANREDLSIGEPPSRDVSASKPPVA